MALALSDVEVGGIFSVAVALVSTVGIILVAILTRESRRQNRAAEQTVTDFEQAWAARGRLMDGDHHDLKVALDRIDALERDRDASVAREQDCLEALQLSANRIAVLEERLGVTSGE